MIERLLSDAFRRYYRSHEVPAPPAIERREFGVGAYGRKIVKRHMSFATEREFQNYLKTNAPHYISYSVGYFEYPDAPSMEEKHLLGADLIFEFDSDELGLFAPHDVWICPHCGAKGFVKEFLDKGKSPVACPRCGDPIKIIMFPDPSREERLKEEVDTLVKDFLLDEWGLSPKEIALNFSGNRGYHVHIRSEAFMELDKEARVELTEYITGQALDVRYFFDVTKYPLRGPKPSDPGWPGRVARAVVRALERAKRVSDLVILGMDAASARKLFHDRAMFVESVKRGVWPIPGTRGEDIFAPIQRLVKGLSPYMGKEVDTNTSVDIHRLIRVPDTIHGGTGLLAKRLTDIWSFDPFKDAVALPARPELEVEVDIAPEFEFAGETWGPYRNQKLLLPLHVSIYLMSRGVARWTLTSGN